MESKGLLELNVRNPYFQIIAERNKKEHCRFCQSDVNLIRCEKCDEIIKKECHECNGYDGEDFDHICERNFSGFMRD